MLRWTNRRKPKKILLTAINNLWSKEDTRRFKYEYSATEQNLLRFKKYKKYNPKNMFSLFLEKLKISDKIPYNEHS